MRLIDGDALKDNMFHYAAPEMVWDKGDIEHKINEMPTIDAIPVEWLREFDLYYAGISGGTPYMNELVKAWQKGQVARDG